MSYKMVNTSTGDTIILSDTEWPELLEKAEAAGWHPEGTKYDIKLELDLNSYDDEDSVAENLFVYITLNHRFIEWNGSYVEKENQIVTSEDAYYMKKALEDEAIPEQIMKFLESGEFRIHTDRFL